ncbi:MAG: DUF2247 family protein [Phycisphaerae bacterium]
MSVFETVKASFGANWTTVLVGWEGLGAFSPWPDRWIEFPPLILAEEVAAYADERLAVASAAVEQDLTVSLSMADLEDKTREEIRDQLVALSKLDGGEREIELRKWRLALLEQLLERVPQDPLQGLMALTEFWQQWGFPPDSPHEVQGRDNDIPTSEYYQEATLNRILARHRAWAEDERAAIEKQQAR